MLATIPLDQIENGQRLRDLSEAQVEALMNSIGDVGLINPITVYRRTLFNGGNAVEGYGLVAGLHRKTACERLGLVEIEANILELSDLECQIAECDENLCAPQLSPSDRARFTKRRKEAYEALHPETRHGANQRPSGHFGHTEAPSFVTATANATGTSERTVRRNAEIGDKIEDAALAVVKGTPLDTTKFLESLKAVPKQQQVKTVREQLRTIREAPRKIVRVADAPLDHDEAVERQVAALMALWNKTGPEARNEFLARIDTPVFDRSAA